MDVCCKDYNPLECPADCAKGKRTDTITRLGMDSQALWETFGGTTRCPLTTKEEIK